MGVQINHIDFALELIDENPYCDVEIISSVYESEPYGYLEQENFFNAVCKIKTLYPPIDLFNFLKRIETEAGRKNSGKWGPREIDLDILFYNDLICSDDNLTIPHKDILNRDFVLIPLCEIEPELIHPVLNKKIDEICILDSKRHIIRKIPHKVLIK